ncbi:MAG: RecX family transcriptional regulator [Bacteroidales bacterium]|nr:RecX family transcriptional regulator [Bacteroidales bacterium]
MDEKKLKVLNRLRGLCSRREYCVADVLKKATDGLEGDRAAAQEVVDVLVKEKYVDDLRYASAFARDKSAIQGWGEVKIRYMLSAKGVSRDVIDKALEEIDQDKADSRLEKLLQNKLKSLKDDPQCRFKLLRFALGRGYSYDEVNSLINTLLK